jgi:hypothetical protein
MSTIADWSAAWQQITVASHVLDRPAREAFRD